MKKWRPIIPVFLLIFILCGFTEPQECDIFDRVVVTGASVTSGFGVKTPPMKGDLGAYPVNMQHIMEAIIVSPHENVRFMSDMMFFRKPKELGDAFVKQIVEYKPTLVVGIDFLFWFGYGSTELFEDPKQSREQKFEYGLELLSKIDATIIVGDLPDMHRAVGKMLSANAVPTVETLKKLNARLHEWANERPNVTVIHIHALFESLFNNEKITILESIWPAGSQTKLLQKDMLHTTLEGTVIASLLIADALGTDCVETDPKVIMKKAAAKAREYYKKHEKDTQEFVAPS